MRFTRLNPKEKVIDRLQNEINTLKAKLAQHDPNRLPIPKLNEQQIQSKSKYLAANTILKIQLDIYIKVLEGLLNNVTSLLQIINQHKGGKDEEVMTLIRLEAEKGRSSVDDESNIFDMIKDHIKKRPKHFKSVLVHLNKLHDKTTLWNRMGIELKDVKASKEMLRKANDHVALKISEIKALRNTLDNPHYFSVEEVLHVLGKESMSKVIEDLQYKSYLDYLENIRKSTQSFYINLKDGLSHNNDFAKSYLQAVANIDTFIQQVKERRLQQSEPGTSGSQEGGAPDDGFDDSDTYWEDNDTDWEDNDTDKPTHYTWYDSNHESIKKLETYGKGLYDECLDFIRQNSSKENFSTVFSNYLTVKEETFGKMYKDLYKDTQEHIFEAFYKIELDEVTRKQSEHILNLALRNTKDIDGKMFLDKEMLQNHIYRL